MHFHRQARVNNEVKLPCAVDLLAYVTFSIYELAKNDQTNCFVSSMSPVSQVSIGDEGTSGRLSLY